MSIHSRNELVLNLGEFYAFRDVAKVVVDEEETMDEMKVGFPCQHLYTNGQVYPDGHCAEDALCAKAIRKLKGRDLMIAQAASESGCSVYLRPFVSHDYS